MAGAHSSLIIAKLNPPHNRALVALGVCESLKYQFLMIVLLIAGCADRSDSISTCKLAEENFIIEERKKGELILRAAFDTSGGVYFSGPTQMKSATDIRTNESFQFLRDSQILSIKFRKSVREFYAVKRSCVANLNEFFKTNNISVKVVEQGN